MKLQALFQPVTYFIAMFAAVTVIAGASSASSVEPGKMAPDFTATDTNGKEVKLSALKGKIVVLEWNNPECPFVKKHYDKGDMQALQKDITGKDVVWVSINSGALGKQGAMTADEANALIKEKKASPSHYVLDPSGEIGHLYGAKTTPHMFVIDKDGKIAYMGAIDSIPSADQADVKKADNYITAAVDALSEGKNPAVMQTKPYGCAVKYAD